MYKSGAQEFIAALQETLDYPWDGPETVTYLRLDKTGEVDPELLHGPQGLPPADPVTDAFNLIIHQAQNLCVDHVILGLNEVFKAYLKRINPENQRLLTGRITDCLLLIFLFVSRDSFPYTEKVWEGISSMTKPAGVFLIKNRLADAAPSFFEFIADLGRQAARKDLSTGRLQHAFRIWEMTARDFSLPHLESQVRNLRRNLEE